MPASSTAIASALPHTNPAVSHTKANTAASTSPLSLRPDLAVMEAYVAGNSYAIAIIDGWRFQYPIVQMDAAEFERIASERQMTFNA